MANGTINRNGAAAEDEYPMTAGTITPDQQQLDEWIKSGAAKRQEMSLKVLKLDERLQGREKLNVDHLHRLSKILLDLGRLDPIVVIFDGESYWVADGWHRVKAHQNAGKRSVSAWVIPGTFETALKFAASANQNNVTSLPRDKRDMRRVCYLAFASEEMWGWSDSRIANHCGIGKGTIKKFRINYAEENSRDLPRCIIGSNGKTMLYSNPNTFKDKRSIFNTGDGVFKSKFLGKPFSGKTEDEVINKVEQEKSRITNGESRFSRNHAFLRWLTRRRVYGKLLDFPGSGGRGQHGLIGSDWVATTHIPEGTDTIAAACGRTEFLQNYAGAAEHPKRIVFLYRGRQPAQESYYPGVRFMTPEEFVEQMTGQKCEDDGGGE